MEAGRLDRRVTIQQSQVTGHNSFNEPIRTWVDLATVWAQVTDVGGREYFAAAAVQAERTSRFLIRWRSDVTETMRISYGGKIYDIRSIAEVGRRVGLDIRAQAQN